MRPTAFVCVLLGVGLALAAPGRASDPEAGTRLLQHFSPEEIRGGPQILHSTRTPEGLLVFAANRSILSYDGNRWRATRLGTPRRLTTDSEGRVWVGCDGDLGYLEWQGSELRFVSLRAELPEGERPTGRIVATEVVADGVFFVYQNRVVRRTPQGLESWTFEGPEAEGAAGLGDRLLIYRSGLGPVPWQGSTESWPTVAEGEGPAGGPRSTVHTVLPHDGGLVLGTEAGRLFYWREGKFGSFSPDAETRIGGAPIYHLIRLSDGSIALASRGGGALVLSATGEVDRTYGTANGLPGDEVYTVVEGDQGSLWLGLLPGIVRISSAPITFYDGPELLHRVIRHQGHLYLGSMEGGFRLAPSRPPEPARMEPVAGLVGSISSWASTPWGLFAGGRGGIHRVEGLVAERRSSAGSTLAWQPRAGVVLAASGTTLRVAVPDADGAWRWIEHPGAIPERVVEILPDRDAAWMLPPGPRKLYRLTLPDGPEGTPDVETFETTAPWARPLALDGELLIVDRDRVVRFDETLHQFAVDPRFDIAAWRPPGVDRYEIKALLDGSLWVGRRDRLTRLERRPDGSFEPGDQVHGLATQLTFDMWPDPEASNVLWLATDRGPARVETDRLERVEAVPSIRFLPPEAAALDEPDGLPPVVRHSTAAFRFEVAVPYYEEPDLNRFRYRLVGLDDTWSDWTREPVKEYTNLPGDDYRFEVEAQHAGMVLGRATLAFEVLPSWYQTGWARSGFLLAVLALLWGLGRIQHRKLVYQRSLVERERQVNQGLRDLDRIKDAFLANTSHELRTPLFGITGLAESLLEGERTVDDGPTRSSLELIAASGRRLGRLVDDLLDHSSLNHRSLHLDRMAVDLHALVDIVLTLSKPLVANKPIRRVNAVARDLPPVLADSDRLGQILHNLVGNAIKFTERGEIEVTAEPRKPSVWDMETGDEDPAEELVITVRDTGMGIPEDDLERIFEAFEQLDSGRARARGGTGLGLAVTRQLVELHGGEIWAESEVGEGTCFRFTLPLAEPDQEVVPTEDVLLARVAARLRPETDLEVGRWDEVPASSLGGPRILVVDDEPVVLEVLARQLGSAGFEVIRARSGEEALACLDEQELDLVLLDLMMPRMSGYEVCRRLRQRFARQELPVIFLTARHLVPDLVEGLAVGGNDYLTKPIAKDELLARVRTHLALLQVHRDLETRNHELARLNHTISHDLGNELTTIMNFIDLARRDVAKGRRERLDHDLDVLASASAKLKRLLDDLLQLTSIGIHSNPVAPVPFGELVEAARAALASTLEAHGVEVVIEPDLPTVLGDRERLAQIPRQLLENTLAHSGRTHGLRIEVGARGEGTETVFFFRDNGRGIEPTYHERVFELFERLDPEDPEGTGIGLPIVRRIVEFHRGRIWIESVGGGEGCTFHWTLPLAPAESTTATTGITPSTDGAMDTTDGPSP